MITLTTAALPRHDLLGAYFERPNRFVPNIRRMMTPLQMPGVSGGFLRVPYAATTQVESTNRVKGGGFRRGTWSPSDDTYRLRVRGYEEVVTPEDRSMYKNHITSLDALTAARAMDIMLRTEEAEGIAAMLNTTTRPVNTGTLGHTVSVNWSTAASANGILDAKTAHANFRGNCGMAPNFVAMSWLAALELSCQAAVLARLTPTSQPGMVQPLEYIAKALMVQEVIIVDEYKNTATEGQTVVLDNFWDDDYVFFGRKALSADDPTEPCFARTLYCDDDMLGGLETIRSYGEEPNLQDVFGAIQCIQQKNMDTKLGYLMKIRP